jgi:amino acid permease
VETNASMPKPVRQEQKLSDDVLLKAELEYITQTAFQANEDRARVSSFYLVAVGSLVAAVFSTQFVGRNMEPAALAWAFSVLFLVLTILGTLTTLQLARLRSAWYESILAMNQLKDYWLLKSSDEELKQAFRWDTSTIPHRYKINSISYFQTLEVAVLSGFTFGAAVYFLQQALAYACPACNWAYAVAAGILACLVQLFLYKRNLGEEHAS